MIRFGFFTVTDYAFFPGTLATVNSILEFHPEADVFVVVNHKHPLTEPQAECLRACDHVRLVDSRKFERDGRHVNAWELKAYAACDFASRFDVLVGIDSDCLLCSNIDDVIERCHETGGLFGGQDGHGADYDDSYAVYGMPTPARNPKYMSTSLFACACTAGNRRLLQRWAECCNAAQFNGTGPHPGHGDQGVLNAVMFADRAGDRIELLDNRLWSQHWAYWDSIIDHQNLAFINVSAGGQRQRSFHCGGAEKFWAVEHRDRVLDGHALQTYPYMWFLAMFWFGRCGNWRVDPCQYLPPASHHLVRDLVNFFPQIMQVFPQSRAGWDAVSDAIISRALNGVHRMLSLSGGSMSEMIELIRSNPWIRRYAEIGGYEGGSLFTLGLRFLNRDIDFYSVESFMGSMNGTMDGFPLPSRRRFYELLARFPSFRVNLIPGDSGHAAAMFDDASLDCVFIDACHDTPAVLRDIDVWIQKVVPGGIVAGDDYNWDSVRSAVAQRFPHVKVTPSGCVWWIQLPVVTPAESRAIMAPA